MGYLNIFLGAFLGDLLLKKYAEAKLPMGKRVSILGDRIWIRKLHTRGAAGGVLSDQPEVIFFKPWNQLIETGCESTLGHDEQICEIKRFQRII